MLGGSSACVWLVPMTGGRRGWMGRHDAARLRVLKKDLDLEGGGAVYAEDWTR